MMFVNRLSVLVISVFTLYLSTLCACNKPADLDPNPSDLSKGPVPELVDPGHFTILSWTGVKNEYASFGFKKLKEAGINTYLGSYDDIKAAETALTIADEVGIKMIVNCPELFTETERTTSLFSAHPSFLAYHIFDEPELSELEDVAERIRNVEKYDSTHPCYVNLYPNYAWGEDLYLARVRQFAEAVPVKFFSFDNYPCISEDGVTVLRKDWYHNLEDIRTLAKEKQYPFWAFALALAHKTDKRVYPVPTLGELRLQQFSNLVYGATGFQYFTTWGLIQNAKIINGVYERVQRVNSELIGLEPIFAGADIKEVWHIGREIPSGCRAMARTPSGIDHVRAIDGNAIVSFLINNDKQYLAIVNSSPNEKLTLDIGFENKATAFRYDKASVASPFTPGEIQLMPGDIAVFSWK